MDCGERQVPGGQIRAHGAPGNTANSGDGYRKSPTLHRQDSRPRSARARALPRRSASPSPRVQGGRKGRGGGEGENRKTSGCTQQRATPVAPRTLRRPLQSAGGPAGAFANQNIAAWLTSASVLSIGPETPRATEAVPCCGVCPLTRLPNVFHYKPAFAFLSHPLRNPSFLLSLFFSSFISI